MIRNGGKVVNKAYFWEMMDVIEDIKKSNVSDRYYCRMNKVNLTHLNSFRRKLNLADIYEANKYDHLCALVEKYKSCNTPKADFLKEHNVDYKEFTETYTHMSYLKILSEDKPVPEKSKMSFIEIPPKPKYQLMPELEPQSGVVISQQNDIEISITQGIKVLVSPNIDSMKIIKIIELLKDL